MSSFERLNTRVCLIHTAEVGLADTRTILDMTMKICHWKRNLRWPVPDILMSDYGLVCLNINKITKNFLIIKPTRYTNYSNSFLEWNSTCFRQFLCPSSGVFHCTHSNGICYTGLLTACEQEQMLLLASCQHTCMTYTIAVRTVKNSWWWTEELSETCRVSF